MRMRNFWNESHYVVTWKMSSDHDIPVVDFESVLSSSDISTLPQLQQLHSAFSGVGFVFIKNHGIDMNLIERVNSVALSFFSQPLEVKRKCLYCVHGDNDTGHNGYICLGQARENANTPADLHEMFDICSIQECKYPDEKVPEFRPVLTELYREGEKLALKLLEFIGCALKPEEPSFFVKKHTKIGGGHDINCSSVRVLYYPPLPPSFDFGQVHVSNEDGALLRKYEHVDYGSLTLLFPDPVVGGLQVKCDGKWIDVQLMEDTVLVNLGALMQRWTSDRYMATSHRVIVPNDGKIRRLQRQSCAVFIHPDADTIIECADGSNKYPAIVAGEDTRKRSKETSHPDFEQHSLS